MLGFSWAEILLTSAVALVVIGPKDIPKVMFEAGRVLRRLQYVKFALSRQFEDFLKAHDLDNLHESVNFEAARRVDPASEEDESALPQALPRPDRDKENAP